MRSWYYERNELDRLDTVTLMIMFYNVSTLLMLVVKLTATNAKIS